MSARSSTPGLAFFVSFAAFAAACGSPPPPETPTVAAPGITGAPPITTAAPITTSAPASSTAAPIAATPSTAAPSAAAPRNIPLQPSKMLEDVKKIGIDLQKGGALEKIELSQKKKLMQLFQRSMGFARCTGCHAEGDFATVTRNIQITRGMWRHYVVALRDDQGGLLFCDSCHAGSAKVLDRRDQKALTRFMADEYEARLTRADKQEHHCTGCHGEDMQMRILDKIWMIPEK